MENLDVIFIISITVAVIMVMMADGIKGWGLMKKSREIASQKKKILLISLVAGFALLGIALVILLSATSLILAVTKVATLLPREIWWIVLVVISSFALSTLLAIRFPRVRKFFGILAAICLFLGIAWITVWIFYPTQVENVVNWKLEFFQPNKSAVVDWEWQFFLLINAVVAIALTTAILYSKTPAVIILAIIVVAVVPWSIVGEFFSSRETKEVTQREVVEENFYDFIAPDAKWTDWAVIEIGRKFRILTQKGNHIFIQEMDGNKNTLEPVRIGRDEPNPHFSSSGEIRLRFKSDEDHKVRGQIATRPR